MKTTPETTDEQRNETLKNKYVYVRVEELLRWIKQSPYFTQEPPASMKEMRRYRDHVAELVRRVEEIWERESKR